MKFSANLGFLWTDLPLPDAIRAAAAAGFDAVECHWPYEVDPQDVKAALLATGLPMLGLNTRRGNLAAKENGLAALAGREAKARTAIDEAIAYARVIGAANVHVMAGFSTGQDALKAFLANLTYACTAAEPHGITILIEPLNSYDAPRYFLNRTDQALEIIQHIGLPNLKLMFDCYHVQLIHGDLTHQILRLMPFIGHIQFASVPDRGPPDQGEVNYAYLFQLIAASGYDAPLGAEYKPGKQTSDTLAWMNSLKTR